MLLDNNLGLVVLDSKYWYFYRPSEDEASSLSHFPFIFIRKCFQVLERREKIRFRRQPCRQKRKKALESRAFDDTRANSKDDETIKSRTFVIHTNDVRVAWERNYKAARIAFSPSFVIDYYSIREWITVWKWTAKKPSLSGRKVLLHHACPSIIYNHKCFVNESNAATISATDSHVTN